MIRPYRSAASSPMLADLSDDYMGGFTAVRRHFLLSLVSSWHLLKSALVAVRLLQHSWVLV